MNPFIVIRVIHIVFGAVALFIAPLAMMTAKGGLWHRRWGKIYFWAMAGVALTSAAMCWLRTGLFMFFITILSFYLAITGYRVLKRKKVTDKPQALDWGVSLLLALAGGGMIVLGVLSQDKSDRWIKIIFGAISLWLGTADLVRFFKPAPTERAWMIAHMMRFLGAYIATVTAFSVVNFHFLPELVRWLWPTVIGLAGIMIWRNYYVRKFNYGNTL